MTQTFFRQYKGIWFTVSPTTNGWVLADNKHGTNNLMMFSPSKRIDQCFEKWYEEMGKNPEGCTWIMVNQKYEYGK